MKETRYQIIRNSIKTAIKSGKNNFIIYPFGENGLLTKEILNKDFGIMECYIVDNNLARYNCKIKGLKYFREMDCSEYTMLLTIENPETYDEIQNTLEKYFDNLDIVKIFTRGGGYDKEDEIKVYTKCGKYSYGPLCNHWLVESVGAFCSFANGSDVTENHPVDLVSTHPFMYADREANSVFDKLYDEYKDAEWYFPGVNPKGRANKLTKVNIGNDVWLGKNVIITNGANIGNGVIAAAGAVITRSVPDYAVVAGVPARIIRFRYKSEQIEALNKVAWWDWTDDDIRERYDDFYLDITDFLKKYYI